MIEEWKVYKDNTCYPNGSKWEVSNYGRVKKDGELFTPGILNSGYYGFIDGTLHRAIAKMFIPNPDNKPTVNHIDHNRLNNRIDNLEWATYSEQISDPIRIEKYKNTREITSWEPSEEQRQKCSEYFKKWWRTESKEKLEERNQKIKEKKIEWWKNHVISEEEHKKRSDCLKGRKLSEEHKQKIRNAAKDNPNFGMTGKKHSEETRKKLSEKRKEYYKKQKELNVIENQ